jgi:FHA domain/DUF1707 SHOCT-like domain
VKLTLRPSDSDRVRAVRVLKQGYVTGRLSTRTFEERVAAAQSARSRAALRELLADLGARWYAAHAVLGTRRPAVPWATLVLSRCRSGELVVGRGRSCDLVFGDEAVSRRHARFERVGDQWYVTDLGSTNGTYVDGVRVERAPVGIGSRVSLGDAFLDID